jgi:small-conductance mechanosensitive channel
VSHLVVNPVWSKVIAWTVWVIAALNILNLLAPTIGVLDAAAVTFGVNDKLRISVYTVIKAVIAVAVLLSIAIYLTGLLETRLRASRALSPSVQVLFTKALKAILIVVAAWIGIDSPRDRSHCARGLGRRDRRRRL